MKINRFEITVEVCAPVLTKNSAPDAHGIDAVMAKTWFLDAEGGPVRRYYLPGTHIRGLLRESWQELAAYDASFLDWLLMIGEVPAHDDDLNDLPEFREWKRASLFFEDLALADPALAEAKAGTQDVRYRILIDDDRGAADDGKLAMLESPFAAGEVLKFKGNIRFTVPGDFDFKPLQCAIRAGLLWTQGAGSMRSVGFGVLNNAALTPVSRDAVSGATTQAEDLWTVSLGFDRPFCFAKRRLDGNLFEAEAFIPGAAIKAAVATMIDSLKDRTRYHELSAHLHLVRFSHAQPAYDGQPPASQWPLSLIASGDEYLDVIREDGPKPDAAFDIDWKEMKEWRKVRKAYRHPEIERELRVRVQIDSHQRTAEDQKLFGAELLVPWGRMGSDKAGQRIRWVAQANVKDLPPAARDLLFEILQCGLQPMGKTKAFAAVDITGAGKTTVTRANDYAVTLQSGCLLVDPGGLMPDESKPGKRDAASMLAAYQQAWHELSGGLLDVKRFFHRCYLAGGLHFRRRFQELRGQTHGYRPYLMTNAGSTFLLTPKAGEEEKARVLLETWVAEGLPITKSARRFYRIDGRADNELWKFCPWLPENGYGRIAVNQASPSELNPQQATAEGGQ